MSLLRLVIAWLVMAALPLQGLAAASMLFCDQATHATASQQVGHDHASHGHAQAGHDRDAQDHHGPADAEASPSADPGEHAAGSLVDDGHGCPICASCCNLVAASETPTLMADASPPAGLPAQGDARVSTRHEPQPDKPPRA